MPELPEVETVRRGLAPVMEGAAIARLELRRKDLRFPFPADFARKTEGCRITSLSRRAKYLLVELDNGAVIVMHLGMSGSFLIVDGEAGGTAQTVQYHHPRSTDPRHDHVIFHLDQAGQHKCVIYNDPRRFGFMVLAERMELAGHPLIANLGVEPTGNTLNGDAIARLFAGKAAPLKAALLDQKLIAGLGNIYVCEALWQSRLSPRRRAGSIVRIDGSSTPRCEALATAVRDVIARAIEAGGSSLRDHRQTDGTLGYFQHSFNVYDREGEPCNREGCGTAVRRIVQSGRSSFYCPNCQR